MHELEVLLSRLKMEHLSYHVESLLEPPGVGKTHLAIALGMKAVD
ncbi:TPA: ATP-binding protein, partial [Shigella flexneri]|nr:ATP-binding protein [Shigella flexneri]